MLDDLVVGIAGTTASNSAIAITLEGESVLADRIPPDVLDGAAAHTVNTLGLVRANDGVLEGCTVLEDEDSVRVIALSLATAFDTTAIGLVATVERASDGLGLIVGNRALAGRDGEAAIGTSTDGTHLLCGDQREGSGDDGRSAEMHFG